MHILMYYLINMPREESNITQEMRLTSLCGQGYLISEALAAEMSTIYSDVVDWKMFIPPLVNHAGEDDESCALHCQTLTLLLLPQVGQNAGS